MKKMKLNIQLFGATCTVSVTNITQDIINNCSTITIHGTLATDRYSYNYGGAYMEPVISNQPVIGSQTSSQTLAKYKYNLSKSDSDESDWTFTVYHNSDGSCNNLTIAINWYVSNSTNGTSYVSGGYTPITIPRASDVTANNGTLNQSLSISISRKADTFVHTLRYVCGDASGWIADSDHKVTTSATWTPPLSLASQNQTGDSVSCGIFCQTYSSNGDLIGVEDVVTISLTIPDLPPTNVAISSPSDYNSYKDTYGVFIQNKSKITATLSGIPQYTTIKNYSWQIRQNDSTGTLLASGTSSNISHSPTTSGILYISGSITDNRNKSVSTSTTVSVTAYSNPACSLAVSRVDSTSASYTMNGSGTPLNISGYTANVVTYSLVRGSTTVRTTNDGTTYTGTDTIADQSYTYILTASDTISGQTDTKQVSISTTFTLMNFSASGKAMAIGKASEATGDNELLEIALPTEIKNDTTITENLNVEKDLNINGDVDINNNDIMIISKNGNNVLRNNSYGASILSSTANGQSIVFRPNGDNDQTGQATLDTNGKLITSNEVVSKLGSSYGQLRAIATNYGFFIRNDDGSTYFMLTNSGDANGSWNSLRPIYINNASGRVGMANGLNVSDILTLNGRNVATMKELYSNTSGATSVNIGEDTGNYNFYIISWGAGYGEKATSIFIPNFDSMRLTFSSTGAWELVYNFSNSGNYISMSKHSTTGWGDIGKMFKIIGVKF